MATEKDFYLKFLNEVIRNVMLGENDIKLRVQ